MKKKQLKFDTSSANSHKLSNHRLQSFFDITTGVRHNKDL